jgi:hypothetical protein
MSDDTIQMIYRVEPHLVEDPGAVEYMERDARRKFGESLFDWVKENNGGIVGPIHIREETQNDFLFSTGVYRTVTMYCRVTNLPEPPEFRLMGGPADGQIVRTTGASRWRVPMAPPMLTVLAYGEPPTMADLWYAEYERVGGTQAYRFVGVRT